MRLKELFIIPEDQKATEQAFRRVLISTICCVMLCMVCLAGTTWAWFTVDVVNQGNEIQIASASADVYIDGQFVESNYPMQARGLHQIEVRLKHSEKTWNTPVYVLMYRGTECYYFTFLSGETVQYLGVPGGEGGDVSFQVSWIAPVGAKPIEEYVQMHAENGEPAASEGSGQDDATEETTVPVETTTPAESVPPTTVPEEPEQQETTAPTDGE